MAPTSPRLALPYLQPSQAQKHVTHNEALERLDASVQLRVLSFGATQPPAAPAAGDAHALGAGAQGAWAGQDGRLAFWQGSGWVFLQPGEGWLAWSPPEDRLRVFAAGAWKPLPSPIQALDKIGVNTTADATNRLAVSAPATLLSHEGAGHQLKVNKAASTHTASLLFQSNFTGHAEMGLAGGLDFSLKVSDGTAWTDALSVARATGRVTLPQGATVNGSLSGTAVQASPTDATAGRLLTPGAFGLGGPLPPVGNAAATDNGLAPGLYAYVVAAGSTGGPATVAAGTLLHARRAANAGETQLLVVESGTGVAAGAVFARARSGGAWGAWVAAGGAPETGTAASGRWVRHADGTQVAWGSVLTSTTAEAAWTFPMPFVSGGSTLSIQLAAGSTGLAAVSPRYATKTTTSVSVSAFSSANARVAVTVDILATGRWF